MKSKESHENKLRSSIDVQSVETINIPFGQQGQYWAGRTPPPNNPPPNMAVANFVVITNGEGCALNGTAVAAVLINQKRATCFLSASCDWL